MQWLKKYWIYLGAALFGAGIAYFVIYLIYKKVHLMNANEWTPDLYDAIEQWEGRERTAYYDQEAPGSPNRYKGGKGKLTIGVGHIRPVNGVPIYEGMTIDDATIDQLLKEDAAPEIAWIKGNVNGMHTQGQWDAILSFRFNISNQSGTFNSMVTNESTNNKEISDWLNPEIGNHWNTENGIQLPGLVKRRAWESQQFA